MKRYDEICENGFSSMIEDNDGEYVLYDDIVKLLRELQSKGCVDREGVNVILNALCEN